MCVYLVSGSNTFIIIRHKIGNRLILFALRKFYLILLPNRMEWNRTEPQASFNEFRYNYGAARKTKKKLLNYLSNYECAHKTKPKKTHTHKHKHNRKMALELLFDYYEIFHCIHAFNPLCFYRYLFELLNRNNK